MAQMAGPNGRHTPKMTQIPLSAFHTRRDAFPILREPFGDPQGPPLNIILSGKCDFNRVEGAAGAAGYASGKQALVLQHSGELKTQRGRRIWLWLTKQAN